MSFTFCVCHLSTIQSIQIIVLSRFLLLSLYFSLIHCSLFDHILITTFEKLIALHVGLIVFYRHKNIVKYLKLHQLLTLYYVN